MVDLRADASERNLVETQSLLLEEVDRLVNFASACGKIGLEAFLPDGDKGRLTLPRFQVRHAEGSVAPGNQTAFSPARLHVCLLNVMEMAFFVCVHVIWVYASVGTQMG